jgi:hypothetical protein
MDNNEMAGKKTNEALLSQTSVCKILSQAININANADA